MRLMLPALVLAIFCAASWAQSKTLIEWTFDDGKAWGGANHISGVKVEDGVMSGRLDNWDPFLVAPQFEIPATPWQRIEVRMKTDVEGGGQFFWSNTTESDYNGFFPEKNTPFQVIGDGQWHDYVIYPFWHSEKKIILLRLDFPRPAELDYGKVTFAVDYVRVVDLGTPDKLGETDTWDFGGSLRNWEAADGATIKASPEGLLLTTDESPKARIIAPAMDLELNDRLWVHIQMSVDKGSAAYVQWVSSNSSGINNAKFPIKADGRLHSYNIDMSAHNTWADRILMLAFQPTNSSDAKVTVKQVAVALDPMGQAEVACEYVGLENAINRVAPQIPLIMQITNRGGKPADDVRIAELKLPPGMSVVGPDGWREITTVNPFEPETHRVMVCATEPVEGEISLTLSGEGVDPAPVTGDALVLEPLNLARADYVPEPQPVESDYEIGALYFPGFPTMTKWEPIRQHGPERKPVLGWYDEGNPECVDWQIKWAVEHGISYFLVDWYWSAGGRHLEHWVNAYKKARYRGYLKWAMMWANHNAPGTHSEKDQREVTQFWLDNYFNMPEYMQIDGKPVVMIWSVGNMDRDMADKGGAARLLEISREMAVEAGYEGIYFIAMKWPEASTDPKIIQGLADKGFDMTSIYHYMHHGGKAEDPSHFPFELVADSSYDHWKSWNEAGILPFLPNLSTGWDSRPWHGDRATVIYGRTTELFRDICEDAKRFADETGIKRMVLSPLNEWGEGSYAEPCKEFGFGMYDAVRDVLCNKPAGGWPLNITPADVGLGPYDLPDATPMKREVWDFSDGAQGWGPFMGVASFSSADGAIEFETGGRDPAVGVSLYGVAASKVKAVRFRMKVENMPRDDISQLFWSTLTSPVSEATSVKFDLINDGEFHDYMAPVGDNSRWRGRIKTFRFDPCNQMGVKVTIEDVRLVPADE